MRNPVFNLIACGACCVLLYPACSNKAETTSADKEEMPVIELQGYRYDAVAAAADSNAIDVEGGKYWHLQGNGMLPVKIGGSPTPLLRDSLERLAGVLIIDDSCSEPVMRDGLTMTDLKPEDAKACSMSFNQLSVALVTPAVVVWKDYSYSSLCMAAHGVYSTSFVNYGIKEGKILSLPDIMRPGYESRLLDLIRQRIMEDKVPLIVDPDKIEIPADFEITTGGIRFHYGLYEIASYADGEICVSFDSYELEDLFAPGIASRYFPLYD